MKLAGSYILKIIVLSSVGAPVWLMSCPLGALHLSDFQSVHTQTMKITLKLGGEHAPIKLQLQATIKPQDYQNTQLSKYMQRSNMKLPANEILIKNNSKDHCQLTKLQTNCKKPKLSNLEAVSSEKDEKTSWVPGNYYFTGQVFYHRRQIT